VKAAHGVQAVLKTALYFDAGATEVWLAPEKAQ
jgi:hypothetical protein